MFNSLNSSEIGKFFAANSLKEIDPIATWKAVSRVLDPVLRVIAQIALIGLGIAASTLIVVLQFAVILLVYLAINLFSEGNNKPSENTKKIPLLPPVGLEIEPQLEVTVERIFIAPAVDRAVNPIHFFGFFPGGGGGGVNHLAFKDFSRQSDHPKALIIRWEYLNEKKWLTYNEYERYCDLPKVVEPEIQQIEESQKNEETQAIVESNNEAIDEFKIANLEDNEVDTSPSILQPTQYATALASFQICWTAIANLAQKFDATKVSDLKSEASHIKGYRKLKKLELFLALIENPPLDAEFSE